MMLDSCSATDDLILPTNFSEYPLRAKVEEPFIKVFDDQLSDPVLGVKHDWMHRILIQQRGVLQATSNSDQLSSIIKLRSKSDQATATVYSLSCSQVCYLSGVGILLSSLEKRSLCLLEVAGRGTSFSRSVNGVHRSLQKFAEGVELASFWGVWDRHCSCEADYCLPKLFSFCR